MRRRSLFPLCPRPGGISALYCCSSSDLLTQQPGYPSTPPGMPDAGGKAAQRMRRQTRSRKRRRSRGTRGAFGQPCMNPRAAFPSQLVQVPTAWYPTALNPAPALPHHTPTRCIFSKMSHRSSCLHFSLRRGLKEAREQTKRRSQAACNILPSLESADGVYLRDVDDGSQGFQSGAASLADLPRQSISVKLNVGRTEHYSPFPTAARVRPKLGDARLGHLPDARSSLAMYLASGTSATSPAPPLRPPALQHSHQLAKLPKTNTLAACTAPSIAGALLRSPPRGD